jgi:hypothetical protein
MFNVTDPDSQLSLTTNPNSIVQESAGYTSFYICNPDGGMTYYFEEYDSSANSNPFTSNGLIFAFNSTGCYQYQGEFLWDASNYGYDLNPNWGQWTWIAPIGTGWNVVRVSYPNNLWGETANISINNVNYQGLNFSLSADMNIYDFLHLDTIKFVVNSSSGSPTVGYLDDISYSTSGSAITSTDFPFLAALSPTSLYNLFYIPKVFNWDEFYNFLTQFIPSAQSAIPASMDLSLSSLFGSIVANNKTTFSIDFNSNMVQQILSAVGTATNIPALANLTIASATLGNFTWDFQTTWDKAIGCLNSSEISIYYPSVGMYRQVGICLIATQSLQPDQHCDWVYSGGWESTQTSQLVTIPVASAPMVSDMANDGYPAQIPPEWDAFNTTNTQVFLETFAQKADLGQLVWSWLEPWLILVSGGVFAVVGVVYAAKYRKTGRL